jgi:hypothetical protein
VSYIYKYIFSSSDFLSILYVWESGSLGSRLKGFWRAQARISEESILGCKLFPEISGPGAAFLLHLPSSRPRTQNSNIHLISILIFMLSFLYLPHG